MKKNVNYNFKFKYLTFDELVISLDRLSRFKPPEESYSRVFTDILTKCLISPKYSKNDIELLSADKISKLVEIIWNDSVEKLFNEKRKKSYSKILNFLVKETFKNIDEKTKTLINTNLNIDLLLKNIEYETAPINLKFLIKCHKLKSKKEILEESKKNNLLFPIRKLVIVEGVTEEILLPVFADKTGNNFDKNGIFILGAGGKSKSPSLYTKLKDKLNIPVILLFDNDAKEICNLLDKNLLNKDKSIIIQEGEFEDILSKNLIKRALNNEYEIATPILISDLSISNRMCENIQLFYRTRHLGEYKKSKVSKIIAKNIKYKTDITQEVRDILRQIL